MQGWVWAFFSAVRFQVHCVRGWGWPARVVLTVELWEEDLMTPVRGWFWSKRWRCQSLGGAGDENNFSFFCQKFNNNPKFISGRYYLLRYVAPPERRSCDLQPTDYQIMVVKMITSHPSRVADHLPEQLIAMTGEKVIISTWQWGQWRYSNWNS